MSLSLHPPCRALPALAVAAALAVPAGLAAPAHALPAGPDGQAPIPSAATGENVADPTVTGPIPLTSPLGSPEHGYPFFATDIGLAETGYVEEEFFISGEATRYAADGQTTATVTSTGHPFTTRIVVRRPADEEDFNGVVVAEWYNVSNQFDQEVDWFQTNEHLMREGYAWVGVSAQRAGVHSPTGLKAWSPERYGSLDLTDGGTITDDTLSFDVFSQAVKALRDPEGTDPLGPLDPEYVIATGHSQSAGRLHDYYNSIHPLANVLDAFVLHGGGGPVRTDLETPLFKLNSESDLAINLIGAAMRQPDSDVLRTWEVSGASHGDYKLITEYGGLRIRDVGAPPGSYPGTPQTCDLPGLSRVPQHMVQGAVYDETVEWVAYGAEPPHAPPIQLTDTDPPTVARDEMGLGLGGIRLAQQEVPLRINSGSNTGPGFCFLDGSSVPLSGEVLMGLYPTVESYVEEVVAVTQANAEAGFIPDTFVQDPSWYYLLDDEVTYLQDDEVISEQLAADLHELVAQAQSLGQAGDEAASSDALEQLVAVLTDEVDDEAGYAAVLRAEALIALLGADGGGIEAALDAYLAQVNAYAAEGRLSPFVARKMRAGVERVRAYYEAGNYAKIAWELRRQLRTLEQNRHLVPDDEVWDYLVDEGTRILEAMVEEGMQA